MKRKVFRWIKMVVLAYCLIGIALYYLQDQILFHPEPLSKKYKYQFTEKHDEINIPINQTINLNVIRFSTSDPVPKGVVLYFHGNRKNIGWYAQYADNFTKNGYETWMLEYPGFGKSTGEFTEQGLYGYALQLYKLARTKYNPQHIIIYGKSLGTGIAAELASVRDCKYLILETPYYSMTSLAAHYFPVYPVNKMLHYHFPSNEFVKNVTAPIVIFHGTGDGVVPYSNSIKLKALLKPQDEYVTIDGGSHNSLNDYPLFHEKLDSLLK
ncbi:MAG: alpha/beta fold hydrolase [Bacteroidetes bacterium]|nr:alpha/beta fold hydrolase [Bacteroidota bacterium]MBS1973778.1 alpha/beta fold hydrolase [Bacteroidota bacterium]